MDARILTGSASGKLEVLPYPTKGGQDTADRPTRRGTRAWCEPLAGPVRLKPVTVRRSLALSSPNRIGHIVQDATASALRLRQALPLLTILGIAGCGGDSGDPTAPDDPDAPTLSSIETDIFEPFCAVHHGPSAAAADLDLSVGRSFANLVNVRSTQVDLNLVTPGDVNASYLVHKVEGRAGIVGRQMPIGARPLMNEEIEAIRQWIAAGARNN